MTKKLSRATGDVADPFEGREFVLQEVDPALEQSRMEAERQAMLRRTQERAQADYEIKRIPREGELDKISAMQAERLRKEQQMAEEIQQRDSALGFKSSVGMLGALVDARHSLDNSEASPPQLSQAETRLQRIHRRLLPEVEAVLVSGDPRQVAQLSRTVSDVLSGM